MALELLAQCPDFDLSGTDDRRHTLADHVGRPLALIVSCNHCPYVIAYEPRIVALAHEYAGRGVAFVAVNANDATRYPDDGMEPMRTRAHERGFPFPYVRDDAQTLVRALGARFTPEVFFFDASHRLRYHGRIDDNHRDPARVTTHDFKNAMDAVLAGGDPPVATTMAFGCSIKWK